MIASFLLLFLAAVPVAQSWATDRIVKELRKGFGDRCTVEMGHVSVNLLKRGFTLHNMRVAGDTLSAAGNGGGLEKFELGIAKVMVGGVHLDREHKTIIIGSIEIYSPSADFVVLPSNPEFPKNAQGKDGRFNRVEIEKIIVRSADVKGIVGDDSVRLEGFDVEIKDAVCDIAGKKLDSLGEIVANAVAMSYTYASGMYTTSVKNFEIDSRTLKIFFGHIAVDPHYPKTEFAQRSPNHADWTRIMLGGVELHGIDFGALTDKRLLADSARIGRGDIASYKNRQIESPHQVKKLLSEALQSLGGEVNIPLVDFANLNATYEELPIEGTVAGKVVFTDITGTIRNLSNRSPQNILLDAHCRFTDAGAGLSVAMILPTGGAGTKFTIQGSMGPLKMTALNAMTEPLAKLHINRGSIKSLVFTLQGDNDRAEVDMEMLYNGLSVTVMKLTDRGLKKRPLITWFVDDIAIHPSNPSRGSIRRGTGTHQHDPYRSHFNYLWKSLLPGVRTTVIRQI